MGDPRNIDNPEPRSHHRSEAGSGWSEERDDPIHAPVLFQEVLTGLQAQPGGRYIDATVGSGGHAAGVLAASAPDGRLLGLDRDPSALTVAQGRLVPYGDRALLVNRSFRYLAEVASHHGFTGVDGILFDLGLSFLQLADPTRGFAFMVEGPLDMRFNRLGAGTTAAELVNELPEEDLRDVLYRYGEEKSARRIAGAIVSSRPLLTTTQLADVVANAVGGRRESIHPATRTFQALRIAVNDELGAVEAALPQAIGLLAPGGRAAFISFHSLEDRLVKQFLRRESRDCICSPQVPVCQCGHVASVRLVERKPIRPGADEIEANPRARSARMRVAERI